MSEIITERASEIIIERGLERTSARESIRERAPALALEGEHQRERLLPIYKL